MKSSRRGRIIFIRHGESVWNKTPVRFTGWADVQLTEKGREQAQAAGRCLEIFGIKPTAVYTSLLRRSKDSFEEIAKANPSLYSKISVINSWRLNERHYGALVGLSKLDAEPKFGKEKVMLWRKSWDHRPPPMDMEDLAEYTNVAWAAPLTIINEPGKRGISAMEKGISVPRTESLEDCANRVMPLWSNGILPRIARGETVLIVAHANSIRAMVKHIDHDTMSNEHVRGVNIPSAIPLIYDFIEEVATDEEDEQVQVQRQSLAPASPPPPRMLSIRPIGLPSKLGMRGKYIASKELMRINLNTLLANRDNENDYSFLELVDKPLVDLIDYADEGAGKKDALIITDGRGAVLHSNTAWEALCGFTKDEIVGSTNRFLQGPLTDRDLVSSEIDDPLRAGLPICVKEEQQLVNYRKSGKAFTNSFKTIPIFDWLGVNQAGTTDSGSSSSSSSSNSRNSLSPTHFVSRLEATSDRPDLPSLTKEQMEERDKQLALNKEKNKLQHSNNNNNK